MRKGLVVALLVLLAAVTANASLRVDLFDAEIRLDDDGLLHVTETLTVTFFTPHHGIEREIPVSYRNDATGGNVTIDLRIETVTLNDGPVPLLSQRRGSDRYLRIGDPDRTLTGTHIYEISYTVGRAILFHDDYLQLYWNVTGNDWRIPIERATATITLPGSVTPTDVSTVSYVGYRGTSGRGEPSTLGAAGEILFETGRLHPGEGMTIDLAIPRAQLPIEPPSFLQRALWFLNANKYAGLPILVLIGMVILWYRSGREPRTGTIAPAFEPPSGLGAGEVGVLIDDRIDLRDISAMVLELAVLGHFRIEEIVEEANGLGAKVKGIFKRSGPDDYRFVRTDRGGEGLSGVRETVFQAIFDAEHADERLLSSLDNEFYKSLPSIKSGLYSGLIEAGYYPHNPERVRRSYASFGAIGIGAGLFAWLSMGSLYLGIAIALCGLIVFAFSPIMPRKTRKGVRALEEILGLSEYIERAEVDRIEFHNAPEKSPEVFEKLLPYAVALNLSGVWTKQFEGLLSEPPNWYVGASPTFSGHWFALSMLRLSSGMERSFVSAPRSASSGKSAWSGGSSFGGGFSGGGFGGGGGGGW